MIYYVITYVKNIRSYYDDHMILMVFICDCLANLYNPIFQY